MALLDAGNSLRYLGPDKHVQYTSNLIRGAMVSDCSGNTSAPTANGGNQLPRQQTSLPGFCHANPSEEKGKKVKEANPSTLQSGMTETGFGEGGETLLPIELRGCLALIFILSSPVFSSRQGEKKKKEGQYGGNITAQISYWLTRTHESNFSQVQFLIIFFFPKTKKTYCSFIFRERKKEKMTKRSEVITFKALMARRGKKGNDWSGKLNLPEPLCTQRPSQGHFLLGGLRAPFLLMEGKQNRWDTNCTFIHLKVQGNFPSAPVKFSDCLSIL